MKYIILLLIEIMFLYLLSKNFSGRLIHLFYYLTKSKKKAIYLYSILFLPGIFIHEMAHLLAALFLFVPVGEISFLPDIKDGGEKLGSVEVEKTDFIRGFFIALAPLMFGIAIIFFAVSFVVKAPFLSNWLVNIFMIYIVFEVANNMFISKEDAKVAAGLLIFVLVFAVLVYGLSFWISWRPKLSLSPGLVELIKNVDLYLLAPLLIDAGLISVLKILIRV